MATGTIKYERSKLLWTNPSPTSNRGAFHVALDLSPYRAVLVYFKMNTTSTLGYSAIFPVGEEGWTMVYNITDTGAPWGRAVRVNSASGVSFDSVWGSQGENKALIIPKTVSGIV